MIKLNQRAKELYAAQDQILKLVFEAKDKLFPGQKIILAGGTALARYFLEHRVSYDLYFFVDGRFHPERLQNQLDRIGVHLSDTSMVLPGGVYAVQLHGYARTSKGDPVKISFVEDFYAGCFETVLVGQCVLTEEVSGLYCRKVRTITGAGTASTETGAHVNVGGRQTARDIFDIYALSREVQPLWAFVSEVNQSGANLPEDALLRGLHSLPWKALMEELDQLERLKYTEITVFDIKRYIDETYRAASK